MCLPVINWFKTPTCFCSVSFIGKIGRFKNVSIVFEWAMIFKHLWLVGILPMQQKSVPKYYNVTKIIFVSYKSQFVLQSCLILLIIMIKILHSTLGIKRMRRGLISDILGGWVGGWEFIRHKKYTEKCYKLSKTELILAIVGRINNAKKYVENKCKSCMRHYNFINFTLRRSWHDMYSLCD